MNTDTQTIRTSSAIRITFGLAGLAWFLGLCMGYAWRMVQTGGF